MDQIMNREKITKESFMANMLKAFNPEEKEKDLKAQGAGGKQPMTFMQLISAGFGKANRRQLDPITISAQQEEPDGKMSRST